MTKKHFVALADTIKRHNNACAQNPASPDKAFSDWHIRLLSDFCQSQNPRFNHGHWVAYINGECGANGRRVKS